ncbi:MAG TPA: primosomal protein N' [Thermoanaerobaculia bacterium]|nr:primosomal protein N' [Thermoanaerobaculia bacterium]
MSLVEVAVPLPLPGALTYAIPPELSGLVAAGVRVGVAVGPKRVTGVVLGPAGAPPPEVTVRPLLEVLDAEPVLPRQLLELARFTADYYLAPIGEVLRAMLPPDLEPWGRQRVRLTDRGALAPPRQGLSRRVVDALHQHGPMRVAELHALLGSAELPRELAAMRQRGELALEGGRGRQGSRYEAAYELAGGELDELLARCGRSRPGREAVRWLHAVGRPATQEEVLHQVGCSAAVVRRLARLGVLRPFTQVRSLSLDAHLLGRRQRPPLVLRSDQEAALATVQEALAAGGYAGYLLAGMTGSGKTEVYLRAAAAALEAGHGVLLLVPEIALVPALAREARERFGERLAVLHSGLGSAERQQEWERLRSGTARIVVGPRSALFAPVLDLRLVVVDEEQDPAYKQDSTPRYHGRDLALVRARAAGAVALLVSATPSLESRHNAAHGKLTALSLVHRVGKGGLPTGVLVDLRREKEGRRPGEVTFSAPLREELAGALGSGEQVVLLRNRRGYAPLLLCRACGEDHRCEACGLPRTYHRRTAELLCHYCGATRPVPTACPACGEEALEAVGAGTERVEERFAELFPGVPVATLDRDAARRPGGAAAILERFARGDVQVLVGTQMVSKGHHFPRVALAAVLAADTYLGFPDFRAVERTYTLLTQLAGRAGRGDRPGRVVIQTYHPEHYAIRAALDHDDRLFAEEETRFRRIFHYPPFTRVVHLLVRDRRRERGEERIRQLAQRLGHHPLARGVRVLGPAAAPLERLRGKWRFQLLLRATSGRRLRELVAAVIPQPHGAELVVDVDPYDLL